MIASFQSEHITIHILHFIYHTATAAAVKEHRRYRRIHRQIANHPSPHFTLKNQNQSTTSDSLSIWQITTMFRCDNKHHGSKATSRSLPLRCPGRCGTDTDTTLNCLFVVVTIIWIVFAIYPHCTALHEESAWSGYSRSDPISAETDIINGNDSQIKIPEIVDAVFTLSNS